MGDFSKPSDGIKEEDFQQDNLPDRPYLRMNRSDPVTITKDWVRIPFDGQSFLNANTYPSTPDGQKVEFNDTDNIIEFNRDNLAGYLVQLGFEFRGNITHTNLMDLRFVIPVENGDDIYFPNPDTQKHVDLVQVNKNRVTTVDYNRVVRTTQVLRDGGLAIEVRGSRANLLQCPVMNHAILEIYPL